MCLLEVESILLHLNNTFELLYQLKQTNITFLYINSALNCINVGASL